ncbi:amino acid transporter [Alicyclobacillus tengchongensis]|uniref:Amino acid transporter n=2 Tax=Alicyclobacillus tolerans TaxID=90970 RepID=A0ABT9LUP0_9BACL|nr:amino acid transporter [Alicyclobacillus tengchongensis]
MKPLDLSGKADAREEPKPGDLPVGLLHLPFLRSIGRGVYMSMPEKRSQRLRQTFNLLDLSSLSISSVAPAFSISATTGIMIGYSGIYSLLAILLIAIPFIVSSFTFRTLNRHFPSAGASYHWSTRVLGKRIGRFQGWILLLAYFSSIPPILVPAAQYTLALIYPHGVNQPLLEFLVGSFWIGVAMLPLLSGARPTALITQVFFAVEIFFLILFAILGIMAWPHAHPSLPVEHSPVGGIFLTMIVASTIMDGWEIDSYASEESTQPNRDPGVGGMIGALFALAIYLLFVPMMIWETPGNALAGSADPLVTWIHYLPTTIPHATIWMLVPILASTAGSLWLTAYILIRGVYAMGRDGLLSRRFAKLNSRQAPSLATAVVLMAAWAVMALQLFVHSLNVFFSIVLSTAGFFLIFEFMLDNITATVFLWRMHHRDQLHEKRDRKHSHRIMLMFSSFTSFYLFILLVAFLFLSGRAISPWVNPILAGLLLAGFLYAVKKPSPSQMQESENFCQQYDEGIY